MNTVSIDPRLRARRVEVMKRQGRRRLRLLIAVSAAVVVTLTTWWLLARSPLLDVDAVNVSGAEHTAIEAVLSAAGVEMGQPLVEVDVDAAREAIAGLPWVQEVRSDRTLAGDVNFVLTERVAVAAVPAATGWLIVDADGRVLEAAEQVTDDVVFIEGARWQVAPGGWVSERALPAIEVATLLPAGLRPKVASIHMTDTELQLVLFGGGRVLLGDTTQLDEKFLSALTLLVRLDIRCLEHVDVRAPSVPVLTRVPDCS